MGNLSEGELSDSDDVEVLSSGKRSNYTNTSVVRVNKKGDDDASSQASGFSSGFAYLNGQGMQD